MMLRYMLDANICIYVIRNCHAQLRERFNELADQLCMSVTVITLAELVYGAEKSARPHDAHACRAFRARLDVLPFPSAQPAITGSFGPTLRERASPSGFMT